MALPHLTLLSYTIDSISLGAAVRDELLAFLAHSPGEVHDGEQWRARLRFWWDENPAAGFGQPLGWVLRHEGRVVGCFCCVPMMYQYKGVQIPAVAASTWRVMEEHRSQSLRLFMPLFKLSREMPVLNTSPSPAVKQVLERSGFKSPKSCMRHIFGMGRLLGPLTAVILGKGRGFPRLPKGFRVITNLAEVRTIAHPMMQGGRLEKHLTLDYLRWLVSTPMERLQFAGCVDEAGALSSFLILQPGRFKGLRAWIAVDWFTARESMTELTALTGAICCRPDETAWMLGVVSFEGDDGWLKAPAMHRHDPPPKHYCGLPEALQAVPKRSVLAEGDTFL